MTKPEIGGMSWIIVELPIVPNVRRKRITGDGRRKYAKKFINGVNLPLGNGCSDHSDCFTCPFPEDDCHYGRNGESTIRNYQK